MTGKTGNLGAASSGRAKNGPASAGRGRKIMIDDECYALLKDAESKVVTLRVLRGERATRPTHNEVVKAALRIYLAKLDEEIKGASSARSGVA